LLFSFLNYFTFAAEIKINVKDAPQEGRIRVRLFDSPKSFDDSIPMREESFDLTDGPGYTVKELSGGEYIIVLYIDENNNSELDRNFIGIPKEPVAFSNEYSPKGPPNFNRAAFMLKQDDVLDLVFRPSKPLGDLGRIGLGPVFIAKTSPYRGDDIDLKAFPGISYTGERLQIYGPQIQFGITEVKGVKAAARLSYRFGAYDEDDSSFLAGMGDREDALMLGLSLRKKFPQQVRLSLTYQHDVLDEIGGGLASSSLSKSIRWKNYKISPLIGLNWISEEFSQHDYGVPESRATETRPAYALNDSLNPFLGFNFMHEVGDNWLFIFNSTFEFLDSDIKRSPLIDSDYSISFLSTFNYLF